MFLNHWIVKFETDTICLNFQIRNRRLLSAVALSRLAVSPRALSPEALFLAVFSTSFCGTAPNGDFSIGTFFVKCTNNIVLTPAL